MNMPAPRTFDNYIIKLDILSASSAIYLMIELRLKRQLEFNNRLGGKRFILIDEFSPFLIMVFCSN